MIYDLSDERVRVENLQRMLRLLWMVTGEAPYEVGINGVYGEGTEAAVRYFQERHGLPVTGVADYVTWEAIREEYDRLSLYGEPPLGIRPFLAERNGMVRSGEESDLVMIIQIMLDTLGVLYDFDYVPRNGRFDKATVDAVRKFQQLNDLPSPSGAVDRLTWNLLAEAYNRALVYD